MRVNPDVAAETHPYISTGLQKHKFGVPISEARLLYAQVASLRQLKVMGVSAHIGSQITDTAPFTEAMARLADLVRELRSDGHRISHVDAGGGLGIDYKKSDDESFSTFAGGYARAVSTPLRSLKVHLLLEPGRSIVGPAGALTTRVLYRKNNNGKQFLVTDAAMNDLIRPALYGAHHEIVPVLRSAANFETVDVVGPVCETGDFFARDRDLPRVEQGTCWLFWTPEPTAWLWPRITTRGPEQRKCWSMESRQGLSDGVRESEICCAARSKDRRRYLAKNIASAQRK